MKPTLFESIPYLERDGERLLCDWDDSVAIDAQVVRSLKVAEVHASGVSGWSLEYRNDGPTAIALPYQPSLTLHLGLVDASPMHLWVEKGAGWSSEVGTHREPIGPGYHFSGRFTGYAPPVGEEMIPWSAIFDEETGEGWIFALAHGGNGRIEIARDGDEIVVNAGIDADGEYGTIVETGCSYQTPIAYAMPFQGGLDEGVFRWHRFVQDSIGLPSQDPRLPLLVNSSWGNGLEFDEEQALRMIDDAADLGFELFHIDAGWFRGLGDWHEDPAKFPRGLGYVVDYTHSKGLLCGLWVAWTQGDRIVRGDETVSFENPEQRTWFGRDYAPDWEKVLPYIGADLCLGCEDARNWCLKELIRIVGTTRIDMLEHDQRMVIDECIRADHDHTLHPADVTYRAAEGYNWVYDQLRDRFPDLLFENCVNGGRMIDFSTLQRCHYVCVSDSYDRINVRRAFYDSSYAIPPKMCETYLNNEPGETAALFLAMLRSGLMGMVNFMIDTGLWPNEWRDLARREFQLYKDWIRPLILTGHLYHVSDRPDGKRWDGMQYFDAETGRGILFAFRGTECEASHTFQLRGLDPEATYDLEFRDKSQAEGRVKGSELLKGLTVSLQEPGASELVLIRRS